MSVYHKFEDHDILYSVINASPKVTMASGTAGWRGNVGVSSSLSLYEGVRARTDVYNGSPSGINIFPLDPVDTNSIDKVIFVSGSYPSTGSVHFVKARRVPIPDGGTFNVYVTADDWYEEHFNPICGLFDYYSQYRTSFFTGSQDYYSLYMRQTTALTASNVWFSGSTLPTVSSSFSLSMQIKPTVTGGLGRDFTLQSEFQKFKFYITGSSGKLAFSDYKTVVTSSATVTLGQWQGVHVSVGGGSASFYINGALDSQAAFTGTLSTQTASFLRVGAEHVINALGSSSLGNGFVGFLFESRIWSTQRSTTQVSSSWNSTYAASSSAGLVHYARFNDGPLSTHHGYAKGSGAFDYSTTAVHGQFVNMGSNGAVTNVPLWQPNDNRTFTTYNTPINDQVDMFRVLHVPSMFYGRQIATGSVRLECMAYSNQGLKRVIMDDGHGSLYISGSLCRDVGGEDYTGVMWRKVGNVFYTEGFVVITDPSLLDFGTTFLDTATPTDTLQVNFRGLERISTRTFQCRVPAAEANASNNPTFAKLNPNTGRYELTRDDGTTWITAVGLYNEDRKLIAVAKLAQPIRKREKDKLNIRLRFDY